MGMLFFAVYDCGGKTEKIINRQVDEFLSYQYRVKDVKPQVDVLFISHFHKDHTNGVDYLRSRANVKRMILPQINSSGLAEAFIYNAFVSGGRSVDVNSSAQRLILALATNNRDSYEGAITEVIPVQTDDDKSSEPIDISTLGPRVKSGSVLTIPRTFWVYIPVNVGCDDEKCLELIKKISESFSLENKLIYNEDTETIDWIALQEGLKAASVKDIRSIYASVFGVPKGELQEDGSYKEYYCNHNAYSMPVYSGPILGREIHLDYAFLYTEKVYYQGCRRCYREGYLPHKQRLLSCLYMGDFEAKQEDKFNKLVDALGKYRYRVGLQQVPHHFSKNNHNRDLYEYCLMAFGNVDDHGDISYCNSVKNQIELILGTRPIVITEERETECTFEYDFYL